MDKVTIYFPNIDKGLEVHVDADFRGIGTRKTQRTLILQDQDMDFLYPIKDALLSVNHPYRLIFPCQVHKLSTPGYHMP